MYFTVQFKRDNHAVSIILFIVKMSSFSKKKISFPNKKQDGKSASEVSLAKDH